MCRFNSGFFYRQKVLETLDYYWRVEPGVELTCDVDYDPFLFVSTLVCLAALLLTVRPTDGTQQQELRIHYRTLRIPTNC